MLIKIIPRIQINKIIIRIRINTIIRYMEIRVVIMIFINNKVIERIVQANLFI